MVTTYINPCGAVAQQEKPLAPRQPLGEIRTLGLVSNLKHNADRFLDALGVTLKRRWPQLELLKIQKIASEPAVFDQRWLSRVQAVAAAFGD